MSNLSLELPWAAWQRRLHPASLAVLATALAAFLRFYHLASLAPEAWFDEVWFALRARELIAEPALHVFYRTPWGGGSALMVYLTAGAQLLGFTGISSSRLPSATLGVVAVPLAYACFDEMLREEWPARRRRWIAALAALVLSYLLHWIVVSRVGLESSLAPAAALFCVWQVKRAIRIAGRRAIRSWLLAGLAAGLAQYSGPHARFVLPLVGLVAIHELLRAPGVRRSRPVAGLALAGLAGAAVAAPLALFFIREPEWLLARARITTGAPLSQPGMLLENLGFILLSFNVVGSFDPLTNYPGLPMFDPVQTVGFVAGHAWILWSVRRSAAARDLLMWELVMVMPSLLTSDAPNFQRMAGFAAPAAAVIATGWVVVYRRALGAGLPGRPLAWLSAAALCASLACQSYTLLVRYPRLSILPFSFVAAPVEAARELITRAEAGERVFVARNPEDDDVIAFEFLFPGTPVERLDFRQCLPLSDARATRTNYLVLTRRDRGSVSSLVTAYPAATLTASYFWQDSGTWLEVPPGVRGPLPPVSVQANFEPGLRLRGYDWSGPAVPAGGSLFLTLYWRAENDMPTDYTSFVHVGTGLGGTSIVAQRDGQPCQGLFPTSRWRAGDLVRDSFAITFAADTPAGEYPLAVGWYSYPDLERLPLLSADRPLPDNRAIIGAVSVAP